VLGRGRIAGAALLVHVVSLLRSHPPDVPRVRVAANVTPVRLERPTTPLAPNLTTRSWLRSDVAEALAPPSFHVTRRASRTVPGCISQYRDADPSAPEVHGVSQVNVAW
jgi:hypothetical protein